MSKLISIETILKNLDLMDPVKFGEMITDDSVFVNGNMPAVVGRDNIFKAQTEFFAAIKDMSHTIKRSWVSEDAIAAEMVVTYTKHDGTIVALPVTDVYTFKDGKISGTYVYMDIAPLFA